MGEIDQILAKANLKSLNIAIEKNHPVIDGAAESIHIQTGTFRLELELDEFRSLCATILDASSALSAIKKTVK